jgi:DNA primase
MREKEVERADVETCHAVYTALLSHLKLSLAHGDLLLNERGLSETTITNNLYASVPDGTKGNRLARAMARFFDLKGVPGFYFKDGRWQLNTSCKGFYVPYRDEHGRIHGLQIRRDSNVEPKYLWLSSRDLPEGTPASVCVHFTKPDLALRDGEVLITEGALKADRISEFCQISCVAVAGVTATSPDMLSALLKRAFPELQDVIIAFDMDWQEKKEVKEALLRLLHRLRDDGMTVKVRTWDLSLGKGLDDALYQTERRAA